MQFAASISLATLAILGAVIAAPTQTDVVVPEAELVQIEAFDSTAAEAAKKTISDMMATGSDDSACADLASSLLDEVTTSVSDATAILDGMPDGSACVEEMSTEVSAAETALSDARSAKTAADEAAAAAKSASVTFAPVTFDSLVEGHCDAFFTDPAYTAAKTTADTADATAASAAATVAAEETALESARTAAASAKKACECDAYHAYQAALATARADEAKHAEAWKKGKHMQCVLAGTAPDACDVGTPPTVTERTLAAGVDGADCPAPASGGGVEGAVVAPDRELPDGGEFGPAAPSMKLCVYTDPANVDFASGEHSEGPAILADLRSYLTDGDARLTEMPNIAEMDAKCAPGGTMVIPECERTAISEATAEHMKRYVEDGGTVIFTDDSVGNVATAVNTIAGLSWTSGSNSVATKKTTSARFADTPETLPSLNGGAAVKASSFGAGSNVLYESSSGDVLVGQVRVGAGQVWWLGFDWFMGNHSPGGGGGGAGVRDGWAQVLAAAVGK